MTDNLPSTKLFGDYNADDDLKDMRSQDKILPRLRLAQFTSQNVKDGLVKGGAWFNSATNDTVIAADKVGQIIPLMFWMEWMEWNPDKSAPKGVGPGKAILGREVDPNGLLAQSATRFEKIMTPKGQKLRVTEYYTFLVLAPDYFGNYFDMMMLNFSKTSHKMGKLWLNRMRGFMVKDTDGSTVRAPIAAVSWELGRKKDTNDGQEYFIADIGVGKQLPADVIAQTLAVATQCKARRNEVVKANVAEEVSEDATVVQTNPDL